MALFEGDDLVSVQTPDGRTLQLPRSAVPSSMLPQSGVPTLAPPPIMSGLAGGPQASPVDVVPSMTGGAVPSDPTVLQAPPGVASIPSEPDYNLGTVDNRDATVGKSNRAYGKQQAVSAASAKHQAAAAAAYAASPAGKLDAENARREAAINAEAVAQTKKADIEAGASDLIHTATEARNVELDKLYAKRATDAQAALNAETKKAGEVDAMRKKIAGTKIDRTLDHPVLVAISAALAGIGEGMNREKVTTGDIINNVIDRKVAAQMADLDQMGKVYGMSREDLASLKERGKSQLELHNLMIAGETDKAVRQIQEMTSRVESSKIKADSAVLISQLQQRASDKSTAATQWGLDYDQKKQAEQGQNNRFYVGLNQAERHHQDDVTDRRTEMWLNQEKALAAAKATGDAAAMKEQREALKDNETRGIFNVNTKEPLLTPKGRTMLDEADKYEANARQLEARAPNDVSGAAATQAKAWREKAQITRGNAVLQEQVRAGDPVLTGKLRSQYSAVQAMTNNADKIEELFDGPDGGKAFVANSPVQQEIASRYADLLLGTKTADQLGVLSRPDIALVKEQIGIDPTSDAWTVGNIAAAVGVKLGKDPQGFRRALHSVIDNAQQKVYLEMNGTNYGGSQKDLFRSRARVDTDTPEAKALDRLQQEKTPLENAANVPSGTMAEIGRAGYGGLNPYTPSLDQERAQVEGSGSATHIGLSKNQAADFDTLLSSYNKGTPQGLRAGEVLVAQIGTDATKRPELALALLRNLQQYSPHDLYQKARAVVPPDSDVDKQISAEETSRIATSPEVTPIDVLGQQLRVSGYKDTTAKTEIARRAGDKDSRDRKAAAALLLEYLQETRAPARDYPAPANSTLRIGQGAPAEAPFSYADEDARAAAARRRQEGR